MTPQKESPITTDKNVCLELTLSHNHVVNGAYVVPGKINDVCKEV